MAGKEQKLADFNAQCLTEFDYTSLQNDFAKTRIILSTKRLILINNHFENTTIPFNQIQSIGQKGYRYNKTATASIIYQHNTSNCTAIIRAPWRSLSKFLTILFRAILDNTKINTKHPAKIGGKITNSEWNNTSICIKPSSLILKNAAEIKLKAVENVALENRTIRKNTQPVLEVDHFTTDSVATTQLYTPNNQTFNLLNDFIQIKYKQLLENINSIHLNKEEMNLVIGIYSGLTENQLPDMVGKTRKELKNMLNRLRKKGVLNGSNTSIELSSEGRIIARKNF